MSPLKERTGSSHKEANLSSAMSVVMAITIVFLLIPGPAFPENAEAGCNGRINASFIQPLYAHDTFTMENWNKLFNELENLGICRLIVQWTVYDNTAFYQSKQFRSLNNNVIETILQKASERGIKVYVGLYNSGDYWTMIGKNDRAVDVYMDRTYTNTAKAAGELVPLAEKYPSFAGWYITQEIDDVNWLQPSKKKVLVDFLKKTTQRLRKLTPGKPVAISGFSNAFLDPESFKSFWNSLIRSSHPDLVLFQDGIGAKKQTFITAPLYFKKIHEAASENSVKLSIIVEIFRIVSENPFRAIPAPIKEIAGQIELASPYSGDLMTAFSIPEYMTSLAGDEALGLQKDYLDQYNLLKNSCGCLDKDSR
jgi:hypothetical protein